MLATLALFTLFATQAFAAGISAHIGCWGSLGPGRACTGDVVTCINTGQSDLPMTFDSLLAYYTINGFRSDTIQRIGQPTTIRLPLSDSFPGPFVPPFYVVQTKPSGELDVVYLTPTYGFAPGTFLIHAGSTGQIIFGPTSSGTWGAGYTTGVVLSNCQSPLWRARITQNTIPKPPSRLRFKRIRVKIMMPN
jgi:hypothetical protein